MEKSLVTIFSAGNKGELLVVKSILDELNIQYFVLNENSQDLMGLGTIGSGYNLSIGPVEIKVFEEDSLIAKKALENISDQHVSSGTDYTFYKSILVISLVIFLILLAVLLVKC